MQISNALYPCARPGTTSALHTALAAFKWALEKYILENPTHNDFILAEAYELYRKNGSSWSSNKRCLFSQQIIGWVQESAKKTSSFRLQDYAQGIFYRAERNEPPTRSYNLRDTSVDIRSLGYLGSTSCISVLASVAPDANRGVYWQALGLWCCRSNFRLLEKLCRAKTAGFQNAMRRAQEHLRDRSDECHCIVQ